MNTEPTMLEALQNQIAELTVVVRDLAQRLPTLVTVDEAARIFNVSTKTVRRRIRDREWPVVRVGRVVRIDLTQVRPMSTKVL